MEGSTQLVVGAEQELARLARHLLRVRVGVRVRVGLGLGLANRVGVRFRVS